MTGDRGGDGEFLAPVIPLFGARDDEERSPSDRHPARRSSRLRALNSADPTEAPSPAVGVSRSGADRFGVKGSLDGESTRESQPGEVNAGEGHVGLPRLRSVSFSAVEESSADSLTESSDDAVSRASDVLVRRLRNKQFSVSEARDLLRSLDFEAEIVETVIDDFLERRYLDDRSLTENVARSAVERKGQGRMMVRRALTQRGIPRDLIDEVLAEHEDDDAERALEFARDRARSLARLDHEVALRRLVGQLARRGYASGVAMSAARRALDEHSGKRFRSGNVSSVRFHDSGDGEDE